MSVISIDVSGLTGVGKTTVIGLLQDFLHQQGFETVYTDTVDGSTVPKARTLTPEQWQAKREAGRLPKIHFVEKPMKGS